MGTRTFAYNGKLQPESESITGLYSETLTRTYEDGTGVPGRNSGFFIGNPETPEYTVTYGYGTKGRFGSLNWNAGTENGIVNYSYVPNSDLLSGYTTDSGLKTAYGYEEKRNLKTSVTNSFGPAGSETVISGYGYLYDSIGRRTSVKNSGTAFTQAAFSRYGYNDRSELTSSERYSGTEITDLSSPVTPENRSYVYDPIGNRKESVAGSQQTLIYESNVLNQYTEISQNASPVAAPEYDDDGNTLKYKDRKYQWNAENRLISVQPETPASGDRKITFLYDYMGRRVRKQFFIHNGTDWNPSPETEKLFVYDGWNLVKESTVTGGGTSVKYYVWGLDLSQSVQGAGGIGGLLCSLENTAVLYYFYDANGNAGQLINAADGSIAAHYEYDPFGNTVTSYGAYADENPFRFSTKYWDGETGLYYYGFRYYLAELGRWWSRDPIGERGGTNLYTFVRNNGIMLYDYIGLNCKEYYLRPYLENQEMANKIAIEMAYIADMRDHVKSVIEYAEEVIKNGGVDSATLKRWNEGLSKGTVEERLAMSSVNLKPWEETLDKFRKMLSSGEIEAKESKINYLSMRYTYHREQEELFLGIYKSCMKNAYGTEKADCCDYCSVYSGVFGSGLAAAGLFDPTKVSWAAALLNAGLTYAVCDLDIKGLSLVSASVAAGTTSMFLEDQSKKILEDRTSKLIESERVNISKALKITGKSLGVIDIGINLYSIEWKKVEMYLRGECDK